MSQINELQALFKEAGTQTQKLTAPLLNNAIFMSNELDKLKEKIQTQGWTVGNQPSGNAKAYNSLIGSFNQTIKTLYFILNDKMPEPTQSNSGNKVFDKIRGATNGKQT